MKVWVHRSTRGSGRRGSGMKGRMRRFIAICCCSAALAAVALPAAADRYDPQEAGHPARVVLDLLIFRPMHWIGSREPLATLFGHEPYDD